MPLRTSRSRLADAAALPRRRVAQCLFEPLGYRWKPHRSRTGFPSRSRSPPSRRSRMLTHLYVLIPVLDDEKHYWVGDDEVEKLLRHGEGWLRRTPSAS